MYKLLCFCYVQALPDAGEAVCCLDKVWISEFSLLWSDFPSLLTEYWISGKKNKAGLDDSYGLLLLLAGDVTVEGDINSDVELSWTVFITTATPGLLQLSCHFCGCCTAYIILLVTRVINGMFITHTNFHDFLWTCASYKCLTDLNSLNLMLSNSNWKHFYCH